MILFLVQLADEVIDKLTFLNKNGSLLCISDSSVKPIKVSKVKATKK